MFWFRLQAVNQHKEANPPLTPPKRGLSYFLPGSSLFPSWEGVKGWVLLYVFQFELFNLILSNYNFLLYGTNFIKHGYLFKERFLFLPETGLKPDPAVSRNQ